MYKRIKTALLFSGKLGDWEHCKASIYKNIINKFNPDIFITTWEDENSKSFIEYYKPVAFEALNFENTIKLLKPSKLPYEPSAGLIPMLAGMKAAFSLCDQYQITKAKEYNLIIRIRPDIQVLEEISELQIKNCLKSKKILLPLFESDNIYNHEEEIKKEFSFSFVYDKASLPNQVNDQLAIGHPEQMFKYMNSISKVYEAIEKLWNEGYPEYMIKVPESVITICLQLQNCKYSQLKGSNSFGNIKTILCKNGKKWRNMGHNSIIAK